MTIMMGNRFCRPLLLGMLTVGVVACQDSATVDDRITINTAEVVGVSASDLTITNRRVEGLANLYYIARTTSGAQYVCVINNGGILDASPRNPPSCGRML